jgi:thioredoxin:protein disulfide reductase
VILALQVITIIAILISSSFTYAQDVDFKKLSNEQVLPDDIRPQDVIQFKSIGAVLSSDGTLVDLDLALTTKNNFTVYQERLSLTSPQGFAVVAMTPPISKIIQDPITGKDTAVFEKGLFKVKLQGLNPLETNSLEVHIRFTGCTQVICLFPYTQILKVSPIRSSEISVGQQSLTTASLNPSPQANSNRLSADSSSSLGLTAYINKYVVNSLAGPQTPFLVILLLVFAGGLLSNLTPCVYPMIPITMRILGNTGRPLWYSFCYGSGIVATYTSLGVFAGLTGSMFGKFMQSPVVNLSFGLLMAILALGMLGYGNLAALQNIGNRIGTGKTSAKSTFLMGMGAGLVAAPCTGPIMIALLSYATKTQDLMQSVAIFLIYSSGFALPYVFLGASTAKLTQRRVNFRIQILVKILFAAIMFGLASYYFRIPLYQQLKVFDSHWNDIAPITGGIGLLITCYILFKPALSTSKRALTIPALFLGISVFGAYKTVSSSATKLTWHKSEAKAFELAKNMNKPVFVDGWAEWCIACIEMDKTTFLNPKVVTELTDNWILLKLDLTESTDENDELIEKYQFQGLPSFALIDFQDQRQLTKVLAGKKSADELINILHEHLKNRTP